VSAPLRLNAGQMAALAAHLQGLTQLTRETGCTLEGYSGMFIKADGAEVGQGLRIFWDAGANEYVIDDRSGE
jgi:hypothetical protein